MPVGAFALVRASSEWQAARLRAKPFYWIVTVVMALAGGGLAWLYFGDNADAVVALHVGLSTPLILQKLTTTVAQTPGGKGGGPSLLKFFEWY
jgi:predicted cobalt transporter CbtA